MTIGRIAELWGEQIPLAHSGAKSGKHLNLFEGGDRSGLHAGLAQSGVMYSNIRIHA